MSQENIGPCDCCGSSSSTTTTDEAPCCGLVCADDLHATIDSECLGLSGHSLAIICTTNAWTGLTTDGCSAGVNISVSVQCIDGVWSAAIGISQAGPCNESHNLSPISVTCDPLSIVFTFSLGGSCCPCGGSSTVTVTVTL